MTDGDMYEGLMAELERIQAESGETSAVFAARFGASRVAWERYRRGNLDPSVRVMRRMIEAFPRLRPMVEACIFPKEATPVT